MSEGDCIYRNCRESLASNTVKLSVYFSLINLKLDDEVLNIHIFVKKTIAELVGIGNPK